VHTPEEYRPPSSPQYVPHAIPQPTSGVAVASLTVGIIGLVGSWCLFGIPSLVAIVLGHVAIRATKRGARAGHGVAVAGLALGYVVILPAFIVTTIFVAPQRVASLLNSLFASF
jgi:hypothetical protein